MRAPWVLIDLSYLAHRARYVMGHLSHDDEPTGVIFGFFEAMLDICYDRRVASNKVAIFFDSHKSKRKELFSEYKAKRHTELDPVEAESRRIMHEQVRRLRKEILPDIGFKLYKQSGLESDDLMAKACESPFIKFGGGTQAVIVTGDGDLYQCITHGVHWFDPGRDLYLDPLAFLKYKGIDASMWASVKALCGCKTDNVPGVPGIGEKSAIDYLTNLIPVHHMRHRNINTSAGRRVAERNLKLVGLPHPDTRFIRLEPPQYNADAFFSWAGKLGMKSYLDSGVRRRLWKSFFDGSMREHKQVARKRGEPRAG